LNYASVAERAADPAEGRRANRRVRIAEGRVIENVKGIGPELKAKFLTKLKVFSRAKSN